MKPKKIIKGIAKTTGKYTLKGLGKGVELAGRGSIKTVHALVKNPSIQKIATGAGMLAAGVAIPTVGMGLIGIVAGKYVWDNSILGKDRSVLKEVNKIVDAGTVVTRKVSKHIVRPALRTLDDKVAKVGRKYQRKIDDVFR